MSYIPSFIKSVQYGSITGNGTATINAVVLANAIVLVLGRSDSSSGAGMDAAGIRCVLTNTTTVTADCTSAGATVKFVVIEFNGIFVVSKQDFSVALNASASNTATITAVNTAKAIVFLRGYLGTGANASNCGFNDEGYTVTLTNSTTVTAVRASSDAGRVCTVYGTVMEFK